MQILVHARVQQHPEELKQSSNQWAKRLLSRYMVNELSNFPECKPVLSAHLYNDKLRPAFVKTVTHFIWGPIRTPILKWDDVFVHAIGILEVCVR